MSNFTENQRKAIGARGNVLVVAGAGTGKTRTLVQRCLDWLAEAPGHHSLEHVLLVTFTDAAAAEMRHRIREELRQRLAASPDSPHLLEQSALLESALISTLHSFCYRLVREHFYELGLDPNVVICPAEEARLLAEETLSKVLEEHYGGRSTEARAVQALIQNQARGWDVPIRRLVLRLHHYSQTLPDPDHWMDQQLRLFSQPDPGPWRDWLLSTLAEWRGDWLELLPAWAAAAPNMADCLAALAALPDKPSLAQAHEAFTAIDAAKKRDWPRGAATKVRDRLKDFFSDAEFLRHLTGACALPVPEPADSPELAHDLARAGDDPLAQDWAWVRRDMRALIELAREFQRAFSGAKHELGVVDFHDLEQLSLRLLWDRATGKPRELAQVWRAKLRLIFVDEYQDINAAQDAILRALASDGAASNRFLVGDPKQSIYRFRLAAPQIFQEYTRAWARAGAGAQVISLSDNFRSVPGILEVVNSLFGQIMRREIGGVEYDQNAQLKAGRDAGNKEATDAAPAQPAPVELLLRLTGGDESHEPAPDDDGSGASELLDGLSNAEMEARLIGGRLAQMRTSGTFVEDRATAKMRPVEWRDMVILLRSPRSKVESFAKEFARLGIPLIASRGGFFDSLAVTDVLNMLALLDNPLQDLPLLAVLRSPLAGLSLDELALIRLASRGRYWTALQLFHRGLAAGLGKAPAGSVAKISDKLSSALKDEALASVAKTAWARADLFLRRFGEWRRLVRQVSLSEGLQQILTDTQYRSYLLAQSLGQQQCRDLGKLLSWARQFDQFQRHGLYRFLRFLEAQREAEIDHEPAPPDTDDAVRLMSIHQSKGLEFAVVVVADLGKAFNLSDLRGSLILDERYGICPSVKPHHTGQRYPSLPHWLAQRQQRRELFGEEMRLLYVAMTRACQRLLLVGTARRTALARWETTGERLATRDLLGARSYLDWVGAWMRHASGRDDWAEQAAGQSERLSWRIYAEREAESASPAAEGPLVSDGGSPARPSSETLEEIARRLSWRYPAELATRQPAKASVSTLRRAIAAQTEHEFAPRRRPGARLTLSKSGLTAADLGSAHHLFLQFVSLDETNGRAALEREADRLVRDGVLGEQERAALDLESLAEFWQSSVGRELRACRDCLHRELPFTLRLSLEEARSLEEASADASSGRYCDDVRLAEDEFIVVTGVVDLAVLRPEETWILDFKTDAVRMGEWKKRARDYEPQLRLYALALNRIYQRPVTRCWLHSIPLRHTLEMTACKL